MSNPPARSYIVLSVSPHEEDHSSLASIMDTANSMLFRAGDLGSALPILKQHQVSVVVCERDLLSGTWLDVLEHVNALPNAPPLIVTSRLADDRLWSEVLNRSGWDVLAKPFDRIEVLRSLKTAWLHWRDRFQTPSLTIKSMRAAS